MITGYTSIKTIFSAIYRNLGINYEIPEENMIEWCSEALQMIGAYGQYEEVSHCIELTGGKAKLPCGFDKLVDITYKGYPVHWATNTNANNYQCHNCRIPVCNLLETQFTFYINDSYIITNINDSTTTDTANVCVVYLGIPTDEDGYPLVPDDVYYVKALTSYITYMIDYQEWRKGKQTDKVYQKSEQDWLFYVNSSRGSANQPSLQQLENLKNVWRRLLPITNDYDRNFKNFNKKEQLKKGY